jgi:hypothetical protein
MLCGGNYTRHVKRIGVQVRLELESRLADN